MRRMHFRLAAQRERQENVSGDGNGFIADVKRRVSPLLQRSQGSGAQQDRTAQNLCGSDEPIRTQLNLNNHVALYVSSLRFCRIRGSDIVREVTGKFFLVNGRLADGRSG